MAQTVFDLLENQMRNTLHSHGHHFVAQSHDTIKVFELGQCEYCGEDVQEANATTIKCSPQLAEDLGMTQLETEPPEVFWDDELDCSVCENCNGK